MLISVYTSTLNKLSDLHISPHDYMEFAELDFKQGDLRGNVNALSNIKKAIDAQFDVVLESFGLLTECEKNQWSLSIKIEMIKSIGVISPAFLKNISMKRKKLENNNKPTESEIQDLLQSTEMLLEIFMNYRRKVNRYINYTNGYAFSLEPEFIKIVEFERTNTSEDFRLRMDLENFEAQPTKTIEITDFTDWIDACKKYVLPAYRVL